MGDGTLLLSVLFACLSVCLSVCQSVPSIHMFRWIHMIYAENFQNAAGAPKDPFCPSPSKKRPATRHNTAIFLLPLRSGFLVDPLWTCLCCHGGCRLLF
jgi:hypothetical protein